jgi:hypothetical protein
MHGPKQPGQWSILRGPNCGKNHQSLRSGKRYRVIKPFQDYDGDRHNPGERWTFLGYSFLPYEDGLSWFVSLDDLREWCIRLQWRAEAQGEILNNLSHYIIEDE